MSMLLLATSKIARVHAWFQRRYCDTHLQRVICHLLPVIEHAVSSHKPGSLLGPCMGRQHMWQQTSMPPCLLHMLQAAEHTDASAAARRGAHHCGNACPAVAARSVPVKPKDSTTGRYACDRVWTCNFREWMGPLSGNHDGEDTARHQERS
jgi:hypothetical protein